MQLLLARAMFIPDRMDWKKPHLSWVSERLYRPFAFLRF